MYVLPLQLCVWLTHSFLVGCRFANWKACFLPLFVSIFFRILILGIRARAVLWWAARHRARTADHHQRYVAPPPPPLICVLSSLCRWPENGLNFLVDVTQGHKTGWYFDQRSNRALVASLARDRDVLDCFCYSGGFTVNALAGGARSVLAVDSSAPSLALVLHTITLWPSVCVCGACVVQDLHHPSS
jgi:hypothetical protein